MGYRISTVEVVKDYEIKRIKIVFEKETKYGDAIHVSAEVNEQEDGSLVTLHRITNRDGDELTVLEAHWEKEEK